MPSSNITVAGSVDGVVPVYLPDARWCWWEFDEIFTGAQGANRYVPKVGDWVKDRVDGVEYEVTAVDDITYLSTLVIRPPVLNSGALSDDDMLLGVGPGGQSDTYRVYIDKSVTPYLLCVDQRLKVGGTAASSARIYKGSDTSSSGVIVSRLYDNSGTLLSQELPLELAAIDDHTSHAIRTVQQGYTNHNLVNGERVTVVILSSSGHVVSKRQCLVEESAFIPVINSAQKYVSHISLETPFLSGLNPQLIEFPVNVQVGNMGLVGVVNYSDGSVLRLPVDGTKFKMFGLDQFLGTVPGQEVPLVLSYTLEANETAYGAVVADGKHMTLSVNLVTLVQDGAYSVKLFGYPVWVNSTVGYTMRWFLYSLDRDVIYDVTQWVIWNTSTGPFDPLAYGFLQTKSVSINLHDISGAFNSYIHTQIVDIVLVAPGTARTTNWTVGEHNQIPIYGTNLKAEAQLVTSTEWKLRIKNGFASQPLWLEALYKNTRPLKNAQTEVDPPTPNFFVVKCGALSAEFSIANWGSVLTVGAGLEINKTLFIEWIYRTPSGDAKVGISGLPIYDAVLP